MNDDQVAYTAPARPALLPAERRTVAAISLVLALRMFGLFMLLPVLALYAVSLPGGTPALAGLAVGAFGITQALLQIPFGLLSDRFGRKGVILAGLAVFGLGSVVAAQADSITALLFGRILQGAGAISAAATALLADRIREVMRTRAMAIVGIGIGTSFILALASGPALAGQFGVPGLFYLAALMAGVAMLVTLSIAGGWQQHSSVQPGELRRCLGNRRLWPLQVGVFLLHLVLTATFVAVPFLLRDQLQLEPAGHSSLYLLGMLLSLPGTVPLIIAVERLQQPLKVFLVGIGLVAAGQAALLLAGSYWGVVVALALFFAGFNFLEARLPARVSQVAGAQSRGTALGMFATGQFLGAFCGGALGGLLLARGGPDAVFGLGTIVGLGWLGVVGLSVAAVLLAARR